MKRVSRGGMAKTKLIHSCSPMSSTARSSVVDATDSTAAVLAGVPLTPEGGQETLFEPDPARVSHLDERFLQWQFTFQCITQFPATT
jgi:hypothetical protein